MAVAVTLVAVCCMLLCGGYAVGIMGFVVRRIVSVVVGMRVVVSVMVMIFEMAWVKSMSLGGVSVTLVLVRASLQDPAGVVEVIRVRYVHVTAATSATAAAVVVGRGVAALRTTMLVVASPRIQRRLIGLCSMAVDHIVTAAHTIVAVSGVLHVMVMIHVIIHVDITFRIIVCVMLDTFLPTGATAGTAAHRTDVRIVTVTVAVMVLVSGSVGRRSMGVWVVVVEVVLAVLDVCDLRVGVRHSGGLAGMPVTLAPPPSFDPLLLVLLLLFMLLCIV